MRHRDPSPQRPASSAGTSIDEDLADQLLADDFIVPSSPIPSRSGTMSYARPTSSAFDGQRRPPSLGSSHGQSPPPVPLAPRSSHSRQPSVATNNTNLEPESRPPSAALLGGALAEAEVSRHDSTGESIGSTYANPFVDPTERVALPEPEISEPEKFAPMAEKDTPAWPLAAEEAPTRRRWTKPKALICVIVAFIIILAIILIPVGLLVIKPKNSSNGSPNGPSLTSPASLGIPPSAVGTVLDSTKWLDWTDFNVTYTNATVGGLSIMGLNSTWNDSTQANSNVPILSQPFPYGKQPIKGIAIGGWLVLEPYITPSLFSIYPLSLGIIDEWTLSAYLGSANASAELEKHYDTFITKSDFKDIRDAGFDHVRISFPYWVIRNVNPTDPYVAQVGWRYLLRAIEYCREFGLRVNIVLHAAPGSQNGWNHSGRQGVIGFLNGTDGQENADLTTGFLEQLSTFFSQPRYINLVTMFSILNEPNMVLLGAAPVDDWTKQAYPAVRNNGFNGAIVISDGFLPPGDFIGTFPQASYPGMVIDMHNYVIFNSGNLAQTHQSKIGFACVAWSGELDESLNPSQGFGGPTIVGEWSIADTDCALYVNSVGEGSRWEGTYDGTVGTTVVGTPGCPGGVDCSCTDANANASAYSDEYKKFLSDFYIAQITSFELSWGWFYWTWDTENATQWSYKKLLEAGIVSVQHSVDSFNCSISPPNYLALGLPETY